MRSGLIAAGFVAITAFGASIPHALNVSPVHRIRLEPLVVPPARTAGLLARVRINGGPSLRLLLDSGSQYVVLNRSAAARSGCRGGDALDLVGAGGVAPSTVMRLRADSLQVGDLTFRDLPLLVAERPFPDGIQGVLPLSVFSTYLIRLDFPSQDLDLLPYGDEPSANADALEILANNGLPFLRATVNGTHEGYFLLDTGAAYNAISQSLARQLHIAESLSSKVEIEGGVATMDAPLVSGTVRVRLGSRNVINGPVIAVDLTTASRYHRLEISGLIGYSALSGSILTLNYRDRALRIEPK